MTEHPRQFLSSLVLAVLVASPAQGVSPELLRTAPRDSLVAVFVEIPPAAHAGGDDSASAPSKNTTLLQTVSELWRQLGGGESAGVFADILESLSVLREYPVAVVVTDVRARSLGEGSYRLSDLQAGLIVKTDGHHGPLTQRIQALLSDLTTRESATITKANAFDTRVYTLVDARLPAWATFRWAAFGDYYVIALGAEAFDAVASTLRGEGPSLADDPALVRRHHDAGGLTATYEWRIDFAGIKGRLDPPLWGRIERVLAALRLDDVDSTLWAVGMHKRAMTATAIHTTGGVDRRVPLAVVADATSAAGQAIPPEARAYAVIAHHPADLVYLARDAYLSSRRTPQQAKLTQIWSRFEEERGVSVRRDLLDQFGDQLIIHTYPEHPLGIPFLVTVLVPITGSSEKARAALDALLAQCAEWFFGDTPSGANAQRNPFAIRLQRADDGVWFLRAGIYGPAVTITDHWLVLSYSPYAVRQNVAFLSRKDALATPQKHR